MKKEIDFNKLKNLVFSEILGLEENSNLVIFKTKCGRIFHMFHQRECCESVYIESVVGDVNDLIDVEIINSEIASSDDISINKKYKKFKNLNKKDSSFTWTFYKLATIRGYVDIRWYGTSSGYYSEKVSFVEIEKRKYFYNYK